MNRISLLRALPITAVAAVVVLALVLIFNAHWRWGAGVLSLAAFGAAGLRLVLPDSVIGVLAVRGRVFDVLFCLSLSAVFAAVVYYRIG